MRSEHECGATVAVRLRVNGVERALAVPPMRRLLDVLREELGLTGSKEGCGEGECGACTVLVDGEATLACLVPVCQVQGAEVLTVEGRGLEEIRAAFLAEGGAQCGICTPGMITMTRAWIDRCAQRREPFTLESAREALAGNLCRCTGYGKVLASALSAAWEVPRVRLELPEDAPGVRAAVALAFGRPDEAELVDRLRASGVEHLALVAERAGSVLGHVLFTPVALAGSDDGVRAFGLAPLAVQPAERRRGLGAALVRAGLAELRARGVELVVVLGEPAYYARFGFENAAALGLACEFEAPDEAFRALWLAPPRPLRGTVRYHPAFGGLT